METQPERMYECIVVGGGIAGLQAAIQLGRYHHDTLVIDANRGRSTLCRSYHNLLGWPTGVSGLELRAHGRRQALSLGIHFETDVVTKVERLAFQRFSLTTETGKQVVAQTLLFATGIRDHIPPIPGIYALLGDLIYICPDCDGYEATGRRTVVLGHGDAGASMALELLHWTHALVYVNHQAQPVRASYERELAAAGIELIAADIQQVEGSQERIVVLLADGREVEAERGFVAFGGNRVESTLPVQLGAACGTHHHIAVHPRTKSTSVPNVWAAGDIVAHSEQVSIALGDGAQAAIFIHKALLGEHVEICGTPGSDR